MADDIQDFLRHQHPYDRLPLGRLQEIAESVTLIALEKGASVYSSGDDLDGLYVIRSGRVAISDAHGNLVSLLEAGNTFGERGLLRDGRAVTTAVVDDAAELLLLSKQSFHDLWDNEDAFRRFFDRGGHIEESAAQRPPDLTTVRVEALMAADPIHTAPSTPIVASCSTLAPEERNTWTSASVMEMS